MRSAARVEYALCDHRDAATDARCRAFILPPPQRDPAGRGAVLVAYRDVTEAAVEAGWITTAQEGDWCPAHKGLVLAARGREAIVRAEAEVALSSLRRKLSGEPAAVELPGGAG
jgi:hypothetical protein